MIILENKKSVTVSFLQYLEHKYMLFVTGKLAENGYVIITERNYLCQEIPDSRVSELRIYLSVICRKYATLSGF